MGLADYIGIPYLDRGRDPSVGLDCWGLVCCWYARELGVQLPSLLDAPSYGTDRAALPALIARQAQAWTRVEAPSRHDVVVLRLAERPFHVGVCLGRMNGALQLLHTCARLGSVCCDLRSPQWAPRVEGYYRYRGDHG